MRKFFRITYYTGITIVVLLVALVGYTQTRGFRTSLQEYILSHYQTVLNGRLSIGRIEGNLITGIRLYDVSLARADTNLFSADRIEINHDPLALFFRRVSLGRVSIINPRIILFRSPNGTWNLSDLFVSSSDTSSPAWDISAKNVEVVDAHVSFVDSVLIRERAKGLRESPPPGVVDYAHVTLDSVNIEAGFQLKPLETSLTLRQLSFSEEGSGIRLKYLDGDFKLTRNEISATNLHLATAHSKLNLDASMARVDITALRNLSELRTKPVKLDLRADRLDTHELKDFLYPWVDFLDHDLTLEVRADGEFGRLNVQKVVVETPESRITLAGTITNLHRPNNLQLDILSSNSAVDYDDIAAHLPGLHLPALGQLGRSRFRLSFKGEPTDFEATVRAETGVGTVNANAELRIKDVLEYKGEFTTTGLNLGKLLKDADLNSRLNLNGSLSGIGTDPYSASTVARVEIDSSEFWGMPLGKSALVFDLNDALLRSHAQLHARTTSYDLSSVLRFPKGDSVLYTLNASVNALNLADIIRSGQFASDLSFTLKAGGKGISIDRLNSSAAFSFLHSTFGDLPFEQGAMDASLDLSRGDTSFFAFRSEPLDIDVKGQFGLPSLVENIIDGVQIVSEGISHRFQTLDSLRGMATVQGTGPAYRMLQASHPKYVDCSYRLTARNLYPVGVFFRWNLAGSLAMQGTIGGSVDSLKFQGSAQVPSFEYRSKSDSYRMTNGKLSLDLTHASRTGPLKNLDASIDFQSDNFSIDNTAFRNTALTVNSHRDSATYQWGALIDSTYQVDVRGTSLFSSNVYSFDVSQIRVGMDFYILENSDPVSLKLGRDGLYVDSLTLAHEVEELGVDGYFNPSGTSDLKFTVNDFLLNNLKSFFSRTSVAEPIKDINGILNASLTLKGKMSDPDVMLDLTANGFRSRDVVFGQVVARSTYTNHLLSLFVELRNRQNDQEMKPDLLISGTVPYEPKSSENRDRGPEGQINLTLYSKGLNMGFLEPILPEVSNLTGTLVCDMKIRGNVDAPTYEGSLALQGTRFFFKPLGIYYTVQGKLIPRGNRVGFENFVIRNIPQDRSDGQLKLSGTFSLVGLKLQDFDLKADGQLLVMKESSRISGQKFYGDLFLGTGPSGIRWDGQLSDSRVTGDVVIKSGRITFPPEHEVTSLENSPVTIIFKDDTSRVSEPVEGKTETTARGAGSTGLYASLGAISDAAKPLSGGTFSSPQPPADNPESKSFLDNIAYDLNIDVQSPTSIRFIFNTQPSEELFADLRGKLAFLRNASQTRLTGEMTLESRSYYYFLKRFDASGKIDFTGDPVNPGLDVTAKYEGIHTLDTLNTVPEKQILNASGQRLTSERVDVLLHITGTKDKPKTRFSLEFPDRDKNRQYVSKDPDADAMSFLLTGYLKDELDPQQRGSFLTANMLSSLTAGLITGPLTNALRKQIGAIQSVDLQYYGGDWNKTDVRVTAEISSAVIRFGGRVIEGINNTNVSVEVPVGSVFGSDLWRNLLFKYERRVDAVESVDQRTQSNSLSLFYRIVF